MHHHGIFCVPLGERPPCPPRAESPTLINIDLKNISDALVNLPQDLIDAGRRLVTVIGHPRLDFTEHYYEGVELASRFRCIRERLARGTVPTHAHLSLLACMIHDFCRDFQQTQDVNSLPPFRASVDSTVADWFREVGSLPRPLIPGLPRYTLNERGEFDKALNLNTDCSSPS